MVDEKVSVEIWKKIVDVQQHFNDLELRVRNFALVLTGAFLALGGYAIKETIFVRFYSFYIPAASLIVLVAIVPLFAFYFMDKHWYHRLLDGAVRAGIAAEKQLQEQGYDLSLGEKISEASPLPNRMFGAMVQPRDGWLFPKRKMHSRHKMDLFYGVLLLALVGVAIALGFGLQPHSTLPAGTDGPPLAKSMSEWSSARLLESSTKTPSVLPSQICPELIRWLCTEGRCHCTSEP